MQFARQTQPRKIILCHGEQEAYESLKKRIVEEMPKTEVLIPEEGKLYDIEL